MFYGLIERRARTHNKNILNEMFGWTFFAHFVSEFIEQQHVLIQHTKFIDC